MKILRKILIFSVLFIGSFISAQNTKTKVWVNGNCESCKARIEKASKNSGATGANWNSETKMLDLEFDVTKTSLDRILKRIAQVGHDNEKYTAPDKVYKSLPACCLYERKPPPTAVENNKTENQQSDSTENEIQKTESSENQINSSEKIENQQTDSAENKIEKTENSENQPNAGEKTKTIDEVNITKAQENLLLSKNSPDLTFNIGQKELLKAACCNLSESFETNATVDISYSNAVTGTKQLKMLGLDQKYTALTKELIPEIRGLSSAYGLTFIPGRWIGGIQLTKGGSTVTNGYESITGQINTELLKLNKNPETELNLFADFQGRTELNLTDISKISERWDQSILLHGNGTFGNSDKNNDGFLDRPKENQENVAYLLNYNDLQNSGWGSHFGINFLKDNRKAGQTDYNWQKPQTEQDKYGVGIDLSQFEIWNKTGYIFRGKSYQSIGWMNQFTYHQQDSFFGLRDYFGKEKSFYSNLIFESIIGNTNNKYKTGASFLYDHYNEDYSTQNFKRTETVPGLFFEYTLTGLKYTLVAGLRTDFHNLAGTQFTPRMNFKYNITPKTIFRISAGKGFRTANIFAENQQYFASNRTVEIAQNGGKIYGLKPEIAWNYGASLQQEFKLFGKKASFVADFFRTDFRNQVLADLDHSPQQILFYNLEGKSFANALQMQFDFSPVQNLDFRIAYKYYDVEADYADGRKEAPFTAKNRGFLNISYATNKTSKDAFWNFDTTLQYVGKQRIPDTKTNPIAFQLPAFSNAYITWNAQISRDFSKNFRAYFGGENLLGYTQKNPILDAKNPFGNYFDGGMVYAPTMPANFYIGVDFKF
jgi:outer membrane receptor protein involved in Fe transport